MNEDNESLFDNLKMHFDKLVSTDLTLDSIGIDTIGFREEAKDIIMSRLHDMAAERLENNTE